MLLVETKASDFETVQTLMNELFPHIKLELISNVNLPRLELPYSFTISISSAEYDEMMDDLIQLEINAFNTGNGEMPPTSDPKYKKFMKYGWLWDLFYNAKITET